MTGRIILEDGTVIVGKSFGYEGIAYGEIVFNTGMTGYQEILTDPSYGGQVVTMTYPLIGNYGINIHDFESKKVQVSGFVVKEYAKEPSHWQMNKSIESYLSENKIIGICDVDTRMITKRIRQVGAMNCVICSDESVKDEELIKGLKSFVFPEDIVAKVSRKSLESYEALIHKSENNKSIAVVDLGLKDGILNQLRKHGYDVFVYPYDADASSIIEHNPKAVLFSNGPGDPKVCKKAIESAKELRGKLPLFGICLGHQILALSLGANTYKLKFGHRGSNHPVINLETNKVFMTSQNHGYAVDSKSLSGDLVLTHLNVNDDTVEGMKLADDSIISVQFHPEEGPGPTDATTIFDEWLLNIEGGR